MISSTAEQFGTNATEGILLKATPYSHVTMEDGITTHQNVKVTLPDNWEVMALINVR